MVNFNYNVKLFTYNGRQLIFIQYPLPNIRETCLLYTLLRGIFDFIQSPLKHSSSCLALFGYQVLGCQNFLVSGPQPLDFHFDSMPSLVFPKLPILHCGLRSPWLFPTSLLQYSVRLYTKLFFFFNTMTFTFAPC